MGQFIKQKQRLRRQRIITREIFILNALEEKELIVKDRLETVVRKDTTIADIVRSRQIDPEYVLSLCKTSCGVQEILTYINALTDLGDQNHDEVYPSEYTSIF